ncbi:C39 family peptidase [Dendronalium sp. ChiSLP03b]|uniref:C39 family peptidase n=1 Tax=Dendronalium sp. ChiSLP03b TaxID=3075381 RepID=UPI002AD46E00|nr:papain-like cysteine protease family protein [Dendronalium sp. ChiSLP03b]MDZ8204633.1 papain-like cysteine protease family protein [Dendronalium sp. ChiSLP03b]
MSSTANPSSRNNNNLPIKLMNQEKERWCWAACILMIVNYLSNSFNRGDVDNNTQRITRQCELVHLLYDRNPINGFFRKIFGPKCCSSHIKGEDCNYWCQLDDFTYLYNKYNITCTLRTSENSDDSKLTFSDIRKEIDHLRPIQIGYMDSRKNGHVVIIRGYEISNKEEFVRVNDPSSQKGSGFLRYKTLSHYSDNQDLIWKYTWQFETK